MPERPNKTILTSTTNEGKDQMKKLLEYGGIAASVVLIAFGIGAIVTGFNGRDQVRHDLGQEQIVGTPDMSPKAIAGEAKGAGLKSVSVPSKSVANQKINTGARAHTFAQYMRIHALEATGGQTYAQMARYMGKNGKPTNDQKAAAVDPKSGKPVDNPARNVWVTETALTTALNTSFFAEQVSMFAVVMGIALLLSGIGFGVVTLRVLRRREPAEAKQAQPKPSSEVALAS